MYRKRTLVRITVVCQDTVKVVFPGWDSECEVTLPIDTFPPECLRVDYRCHCVADCSTDNPEDLKPDQWEFPPFWDPEADKP